MEEDKRQDNRYNESEDFIAGITNVYVNVRGGCMWSSARIVRNSESLHGLDAALLGQSVTASRYVDCIAGASWSVDRYPGFDGTLG